MGTANVALLVLCLVALVGLLIVWRVVPRGLDGLARWRHEQALQAEQLRQERLKTQILEEQLRNEILKDPPAPKRRESEPQG